MPGGYRLSPCGPCTDDLCLVKGFGCKQKKCTVPYGKIKGGGWCLSGQRAGCISLVLFSPEARVIVERTMFSARKECNRRLEVGHQK